MGSFTGPGGVLCLWSPKNFAYRSSDVHPSEANSMMRRRCAVPWGNPWEEFGQSAKDRFLSQIIPVEVSLEKTLWIIVYVRVCVRACVVLCCSFWLQIIASSAHVCIGFIIQVRTPWKWMAWWNIIAAIVACIVLFTSIHWPRKPPNLILWEFFCSHSPGTSISALLPYIC